MVIIGKKKKEVFQTMLDFVEGRITVYEFWKKYVNIKYFRQVVKKKKKYFYPFEQKFYFEPEKENIDLNKLYYRVHILWKIKFFLNLNKIIYEVKSEDEERLLFLEKICPNWISIYDFEWLEEALGIKNKPINEMGSIKSLREKVRSLFKYQKQPPIWVQEEDWPIIDGIPAEFIRQSSNPGSKDWLEEPVDYYFKDHNGKEIIINQLP